MKLLGAGFAKFPILESRSVYRKDAFVVFLINSLMPKIPISRTIFSSIF